MKLKLQMFVYDGLMKLQLQMFVYDRFDETTATNVCTGLGFMKLQLEIFVYEQG